MHTCNHCTNLSFLHCNRLAFRALVQPRVTRAAIRIANHFAPCVNQEHFNFALFTLHTSKYWSGKLDSNQQPLDPQPSAPPLSYSPKTLWGDLDWHRYSCGLQCIDFRTAGNRVSGDLAPPLHPHCQALQLALCAGLVPRGTKTIFAKYVEKSGPQYHALLHFVQPHLPGSYITG
jgi:hypothetical protein